MDDADGGSDRTNVETEREAGGTTATYTETEAERILTFKRDGRTAAVAQNRDGYAMLTVRTASEGEELERYYGFEMALDHVGERLGVPPCELPVPDPAADMGM